MGFVEQKNDVDSCDRIELWEESGLIVTGVLTKKAPLKFSDLLVIENDKEIVGVWSSTVLDTLFKEVPVGSVVEVTYIGEEKSGTGSAYKNFKLALWEGPVPEEFQHLVKTSLAAERRRS